MIFTVDFSCVLNIVCMVCVSTTYSSVSHGKCQAPPEPAAQASPEPAAQGPPEPAAQGPPEPAAQGPPEPAAQGPPEPAAQAPPELAAQAPPEPASQGPPDQAPPEPAAQAPPQPVAQAPPDHDRSTLHLSLQKTPKMSDLMNKVAAEASDKWKKLGQQLDIDHHKLKTISRENDDVLECFAEVFDLWLRDGDPPFITWATIIDALRTKIVGEGQLADKLEQWVMST